MVANEFEDVELLYSSIRLGGEVADVIIVPTKFGLHPRPADPRRPMTGRFGTTVPLLVFREGERHVIKELSELRVDDIDAIVIPGGFSPDYLRRLPDVSNFVREAYNKGKLIAAICHGPWVLISAGLVKGKRIAGVIAIKDDIINAGAMYEDAAVVRDENTMTSRTPDDLSEFCNAIIDALSSH